MQKNKQYSIQINQNTKCARCQQQDFRLAIQLQSYNLIYLFRQWKNLNVYNLLAANHSNVVQNAFRIFLRKFIKVLVFKFKYHNTHLLGHNSCESEIHRGIQWSHSILFKICPLLKLLTNMSACLLMLEKIFPLLACSDSFKM